MSRHGTPPAEAAEAFFDRGFMLLTHERNDHCSLALIRDWRANVAQGSCSGTSGRFASSSEVLTEAEIARLLTAYRQLEGDGEEEQREWWALTRRIVTVAVATGCRRGELLGLRWGDVSMLDGRLTVRQAWVRGEMTSPKSRAGRRTIEFGERTLDVLQEQWQASRYRSDESLVFCHPALGTPLDPSKLSRSYVKPALAKAKIAKPFRPFHGLRHTAITYEAALNPQAYVQMRAGHSQGSITERYIHAAQSPSPAPPSAARIASSPPFRYQVRYQVPLRRTPTKTKTVSVQVWPLRRVRGSGRRGCWRG